MAPAIKQCLPTKYEHTTVAGISTSENGRGWEEISGVGKEELIKKRKRHVATLTVLDSSDEDKVPDDEKKRNIISARVGGMLFDNIYSLPPFIRLVWLFLLYT